MDGDAGVQTADCSVEGPFLQTHLLDVLFAEVGERVVL